MVQNSGIADSYLASMEYKFRPRRDIYSKAELSELWQKTVAAFEGVYYRMFEHFCSQPISGLGDYLEVLSGKDLDQTDFQDYLKNIYLNCRDHGCLHWTTWFAKYPRWRLFYVFPYLLFGQTTYPDQGLEKALGLGSVTNKELVEKKFLDLWNRYN